MLSSPGWRGSTWTTGPNGIRTSPPASAITGSTRAWRILRRRPWTKNGARSTAGPRGSPPSITSALSAEHRVDAAMMADSVARRVFELDELREHTWNPLQANPGKAIYQLLARDFAPLPDRLGSVAGRLAAIPPCWPRPAGSSGACPGSTWRPRSGSSTARSRWSARRSTPRSRPRRSAARSWLRCAPPRSRRWPSTGPGSPPSSPVPMVSPIRGSGRNGSPASCRSR